MTTANNGRLPGFAKPLVAVGTVLANCPPHRSVHAALPHTAPTSGIWRRIAHSDSHAALSDVEEIDPPAGQTDPTPSDSVGSDAIANDATDEPPDPETRPTTGCCRESRSTESTPRSPDPIRRPARRSDDGESSPSVPSPRADEPAIASSKSSASPETHDCGTSRHNCG